MLTIFGTQNLESPQCSYVCFKILTKQRTRLGQFLTINSRVKNQTPSLL